MTSLTGLPETPDAATIAAHFRARIASGALRVGDRLPTIRAVAGEVGVARSTVQLAWRTLQDEGLVESTVGRGTVVRSVPGLQGTAAPGAGPRGWGSNGRAASLEAVGGRATSPSEVDAPSAGTPLLSRAAEAALRTFRAMHPPQPPRDRPVVADFAGLRPDPELFPVDAFRAAVDAVLAGGDGSTLTYGGESSGDRRLRELLAQRHGEDADADRVLVTSGAQQGIELVIRAFASPGDAVAVSVPTYHQLFGVLAAHGVDLLPIEAPDGVADPARVARVLERPEVRLFYAMPSFHNPTGATLDLAQRRALMDVVSRSDVPVLEDEYECELRFRGDELPSLASMDSRGLTVTVRSFSKALFPGVRIGWLEAAPEVLAPLRALKRFSDLESSPFLQAALAGFVESGAMDSYLDRLRGELARRHAAADAALRELFPAGTRWSRPEGGLSLWVVLPEGIDAERVAVRAAAEGVLVTPGRLFDPRPRPCTSMRLSLTRTDEATIARGLEVLGRAAHDEHAALFADDPDSRPLIL